MFASNISSGTRLLILTFTSNMTLM